MARELEGQTAFVTGAARNIGRAIAIALAEGGANVAINALSAREDAQQTADLVEAAGGRAIVCLGDASDPDQVREMVASTVAAFGGLDLLVNNAAIRREGELAEVSFEDWRGILSTSLDAPFLLAQACAPHMIARGGGRIVNIGGMTGHSGAPERVHVVTAKAGLAGMTRALAHDLAPHAITVNCVVPGMIDTVRGGSNAAKPAHHAGRHVPLGRRGRPEEVAGLVRYLCGPDAGFITGQSVHVNGGAFMA